ncbi:MAG: glycosyltransferase family 9 protein [Bacteroidales bacterium]|nr:glycosyltransferase family 9 protein [Bacteroidales bacterium]
MKKILVIRFSSIGDIVLTSPVIRCLAVQLPDTEIHVLTRKVNACLFTSNPSVKKTIAYDKKLNEVIDLLRVENYDHIVDLHKNIRSFRVRFSLRKPATSFPKLNIQKYLLVRFKMKPMPDIHIVDRYFEAVKSLGVVNDGRGLDYFFSDAKKIDTNKWSSDFNNGYYAVVIGGKHTTKILPVEKVIEVCRLLDKPVVLLGGNEDAARGKMIAESLKTNVFDACGKLSLDESARILKVASAVLTNDTGLMHIAAALHKPIVSVWGNTVPELGMSPYLPDEPHKSILIENKEIKCRPCSKIGFDKCPKGHFNCMMTLNSSEIADKLMNIGNLFS